MIRASFAAIPLLVVCGWAIATAGGADHVAAAKAAEQSFHKACDTWEADRAKRRDTSQAAREIVRHHHDFMRHVLETRYIPAAAAMVPEQFASAGSLKRGDDGTNCSYVVGKGQGGLIMSTWSRTPWTRDSLPNHGFEAVLRMPPERQELVDTKFSVGSGTWVGEKRDVLRVPYTLLDTSGVIEVRLVEGKWRMHPDRGVVVFEDDSGSWARWDPFAGPPNNPPLERTAAAVCFTCG